MSRCVSFEFKTDTSAKHGRGRTNFMRLENQSDHNYFLLCQGRRSYVETGTTFEVIQTRED